MKYGKRLAGGLVAASALLGTCLATAPAAEATVRGTAPACVKRDVIKHRKYVKVTNNCRETMHLKVVIDWGNDSPCLTYQPGQQWEWNWGRGSYGKVVTC
ncbi:alpha-amylase [Streptomyces sp. DSM 118878]